VRPDGTSYDVKIGKKIEEYHGKKVDTYTVRWTVAGEPFRSPHRTYPLADSFRSELIAATRAGEPFDIESGLPLSMKRARATGTTAYAFSLKYVDWKWKPISATYRRDIASVMTLFTVALLRAEPRDFPDDELRRALREWAFNSAKRKRTPPWARDVLVWVERNSLPVTVVMDSAKLGELLTAANQKLNGTSTAGSVQLRRHAIISNALSYAAEIDLIDHNPLERGGGRGRGKPKGEGKVKAKTIRPVDKRSLLNKVQARDLFAALERYGRSGARVWLFARIMYYAGTRPEEVASIHVRDLDLPDEGWGELTVCEPTPEIGKQWTDSGEIRDRRRQNKGREVGDVRHVPLHPVLTADIRAYIEADSLRPGDLLLTGVKSGDALSSVTVRTNWSKARLDVLGEDVVDKSGESQRVVRTLTGKRIYDLRHTCLTNWLNSGVPPAQVAEWAGNSVPVLLATYVKCISGQEALYRQRIEETLAIDDEKGTAESRAESPETDPSGQEGE
jgi:integrase